jgi:hypothetical protein
MGQGRATGEVRWERRGDGRGGVMGKAGDGRGSLMGKAG